ncbi:hypothetical protein [Nocardia wallacei]|uniref:hypothetical protein n=1 Tax=Nocardia wallacei TaxID=480035 RepID=UPI002455FD35|nr:hypothetical protein [Nocardia wallacei]
MVVPTGRRLWLVVTVLPTGRWLWLAVAVLPTSRRIWLAVTVLPTGRRLWLVVTVVPTARGISPCRRGIARPGDGFVLAVVVLPTGCGLAFAGPTLLPG